VPVSQKAFPPLYIQDFEHIRQFHLRTTQFDQSIGLCRGHHAVSGQASGSIEQ
jgi:hypothetical protein